MADQVANEVNEVMVEDLVARIQDVDCGLASDATAGGIADLSGMDEQELQKFLEEKSGISPDEEAQGSLMAAAATVAVHC